MTSGGNSIHSIHKRERQLFICYMLHVTFTIYKNTKKHNKSNDLSNTFYAYLYLEYTCQRKSLSTCKIILKNFKFHNFYYDKDNYLKFSAFVYFFTKENAIEVSIK